MTGSWAARREDGGDARGGHVEPELSQLGTMLAGQRTGPKTCFSPWFSHTADHTPWCGSELPSVGSGAYTMPVKFSLPSREESMVNRGLMRVIRATEETTGLDRYLVQRVLHNIEYRCSSTPNDTVSDRSVVVYWSSSVPSGFVGAQPEVLGSSPSQFSLDGDDRQTDTG